MKFLFQKFFETILNFMLEFFSLLIDHFVDNSTLFTIDGLDSLQLTIQTVAACMMIYSIMADIVYRLSGVEGTIYDINIGEYVAKIIMNIIVLMVIPSILLTIGEISTNVLSIANRAGLDAFSINREGDLFLPGLDFNNVSLLGLIMVGTLLFMGIKTIVSLAKVHVELFIILLIAPLSLFDFYKGPDKLKGLLMNVIALITTASIKLILIYLALKIMGEIKLTIFEAKEIIVNWIKISAIFTVAENPQAAVSFMLNPTQGKQGGGMSKAYFGMQAVRSIKSFLTKGAA